MKQCVVRTYRRGYNPPAENINNKLDDGWLVKFPPVPYVDSDGETTCLEYVLEKSADPEPLATIDGVSLYADISNKNGRTNDD